MRVEQAETDILVTLIIAAKSQTEVVVGSESLAIVIDKNPPHAERGRIENQQKLFKLRSDTALLLAGVFNGDQMNQFLETIKYIVASDGLTELSDISDKVSELASNTLKLADHHVVEFIIAGFNGQQPGFEMVASEFSFRPGVPREQYIVGGDKDYASSRLKKELRSSMSDKEIKEVVRSVINGAKKTVPDLGGQTVTKTLRREQENLEK